MTDPERSLEAWNLKGYPNPDDNYWIIEGPDGIHIEWEKSEATIEESPAFLSEGFTVEKAQRIVDTLNSSEYGDGFRDGVRFAKSQVSMALDGLSE